MIRPGSKGASTLMGVAAGLTRKASSPATASNTSVVDFLNCHSSSKQTTTTQCNNQLICWQSHYSTHKGSSNSSSNNNKDAIKHKVDKKRYTHTCNMPKTDFPMRANAVKREIDLQKICVGQLYYDQQFNDKSPDEIFIVHDGPPFANGNLHLGHALNKIVKDIVIRYKMLCGYTVHFRPGWDCHGLPIEIKVKTSEKLNALPKYIRSEARKFADRTLIKQREEFMRWGVLGDWEDPYTTMSNDYEANQLQVFWNMYEKGYIFRAHKPVHWSPSSRTALAEAELEYNEDHVSQAVYCKFPIKMTENEDRLKHVLRAGHLDLSHVMSNEGTGTGTEKKTTASIYEAKISFLCWTTTPWSLPGNVALCINKYHVYSIVEAVAFDGTVFEPKEYWIVMTSMCNDVFRLVTPDRNDGDDARHEVYDGLKAVVEDIPGQDLLGMVTSHPVFADRRSSVIHGDHVVEGVGTGVVHSAPAHGVEDYNICIEARKKGLIDFDMKEVSLVDAMGRYIEDPNVHVPADLVGLDVMGKGHQKVIDGYLIKNNLLVRQYPYTHKYPYDWRTKKPILQRATEQWFGRVGGDLQENAIRALDNVNFYPESNRANLISYVKGRSEWCISRQRVWGLPIPVFYKPESGGGGEHVINQDIIDHLKKLFREKGSQVWWEHDDQNQSTDYLLPLEYRNQGLIKGADTMDVWFDSGSSWHTVIGQDPALNGLTTDLVVEGNDQHRGWFQSSLLTCVASRGEQAPYKNVITHQFVLDGNGRKMSKSLGNIIEPKAIINGGKAFKGNKQLPAYGADVLRYWVSSSDFTQEHHASDEAFRVSGENVRKFRNVGRFMLGCLHDYTVDQEYTFKGNNKYLINPIPRDAVVNSKFDHLDRYMLTRLCILQQQVKGAYEKFQFHSVVNKLSVFCYSELSSFYFTAIKDRLYNNGPNCPIKRSSQHTLHVYLLELFTMIAPVVPHLADDVYACYLKDIRKKDTMGDKGYMLDDKSKSGIYIGHSIFDRVNSWNDKDASYLFANPDTKSLLYSNEQMNKWEFVLAIKGLMQKEVERNALNDLNSVDAVVTLCNGAQRFLEDAESCGLVFKQGKYVGIEHLMNVILGTSSVTFVYSSSDAESEALTRGGTKASYKMQHFGYSFSLVIKLSKTSLHMCPRCWNHSTKEHNCVCKRCLSVLEETGFLGC